MRTVIFWASMLICEAIMALAVSNGYVYVEMDNKYAEFFASIAIFATFLDVLYLVRYLITKKEK